MPSPLENIDDALSLLEMLEQLTAVPSNRTGTGEIPTRGLHLTIRNIGELLVNARNNLRPEQVQRVVGRGNRGPGSQGGGSDPGSGGRGPRSNEGGPSSGHIRELGAPTQSQGMFQRIVLPKEDPSENETVEH